jgi:SH3-like domain-containing protein
MRTKFYIFLVILFTLNIFNTSADEKLNFLSLKKNKVNVRQGPSFNYPIKFIYKKKYLPLIIVDKSDSWRKIKDYENNLGWIHTSQLSKIKSVINIKNNAILYKKPTIYSKPIAKIESGRLFVIKKCRNTWCKVKSENYIGWVSKSNLWGKFK